MPFGRIGRPGLIGLAARTAVVAGTATAVNRGMQNRYQRRAEQDYAQEELQAQQSQAQVDAAAAQAVARQASPQQSVAQQAVAPGADDLVAKIGQLAELHTQGVLSDAEFAAAKSKLLGI